MNILKKIAAMVALALTIALSVTAVFADTLADIHAKGYITVGVKQDYPPWGYLDKNGQIIGLEVDLAQNVADRLGVKLKLVPVVASNRMEFLQQGRIDLIIATMSDTKKRRKVVGMIEPNYYASGANVLAPAGSDLTQWADLNGKNVCAEQGSYYNSSVVQTYNVHLVAFAGITEAASALRNGSCVALLFDNTWIESHLASDPQWKGWKMPFVTEQFEPWAIGVRLSDLNGPFGKKISEIVTDWHRSGFLIERSAANGIAPSPFLQEQHNRFK